METVIPINLPLMGRRHDAASIAHVVERPIRVNQALNILSELYFLNNATVVGGTHKTIELADPAVPGIVGMSFEEPGVAFTPYFLPDESATPHGLTQSQMREILPVINRAMPKKQDFHRVVREARAHVAQAAELREHGVEVASSHLKNEGSVEVFEVKVGDNRAVIRMPKWLHLAAKESISAFDPVAEAIAIGRLAKLLGLVGEMCIPYAMGMFQLAPYLSGQREKMLLEEVTQISLWHRHGFSGFKLPEKIEKIDGVIIDPLELDRNFLRLGHTQKVLSDI